MRRHASLAAVALAAAAAGCGGGFELAVGDCVRLPADGAGADGLAEVTRVDCDEPHELEVFHTFRLGADELERDALVAAVTRECLGDAWTSYLGVPADDSPLELLPIPPGDDDLDRGHREVVCTVREPGAATRTGSLRADADATA